MRHLPDDLRQMQSLPLEAKILMTKQRIKVWYESWSRFDIYNKKTGQTRSVTMDTRNQFTEPELKEDEYVTAVFDGQVYLSFSGGKDSTVLKHIVDSMYDDVPALFVNTGLEYPEIQQFVRRINNGEFDCFRPNVEIVRPEMRFDEVLKNYGYPVISKENSLYIRQCQTPTEKNRATIKLRTEGIKSDGTKTTVGQIPGKWMHLIDAPFSVSEKCCDVMKKNPAKQYAKDTGRKPFIGTLASESRLRYRKWIQHGCNAFEKGNPSSQPLSFWTEQDILLYLKKYNVPYCPVYGEIVSCDLDGNQYDMPLEYLETLAEVDAAPKLATTGCDRTGCIFCMFGISQDGFPNRFQRLKETHPRQYEYCINGGEMVDGKWQPSKDGLGLGKVLDYIGVKYD